jgi:hypothetical protein
MAPVTAAGKPTSKETTTAGRTFLSVQHEAAVVLDWCWDTMDNTTKTTFIEGLKKVANMDAPGYPIVSERAGPAGLAAMSM